MGTDIRLSKSDQKLLEGLGYTVSPTNGPALFKTGSIFAPEGATGGGARTGQSWVVCGGRWHAYLVAPSPSYQTHLTQVLAHRR